MLYTTFYNFLMCLDWLFIFSSNHAKEAVGTALVTSFGCIFLEAEMEIKVIFSSARSALRIRRWATIRKCIYFLVFFYSVGYFLNLTFGQWSFYFLSGFLVSIALIASREIRRQEETKQREKYFELINKTENIHDKSLLIINTPFTEEENSDRSRAGENARWQREKTIEALHKKEDEKPKIDLKPMLAEIEERRQKRLQDNKPMRVIEATEKPLELTNNNEGDFK